jgi:hypothetical protein
MALWRLTGSAALAAMWACLASAEAASPGNSASAPAARVALVIGNGAYAAAPLRTAVADARAIAGRLERAGFTVTLNLDAEKRDMETAIATFADGLAASEIALVFYAGHGIEANGHNYLVPVDARLADESRLRLEAVEIDALFDVVRGAHRGATLAILDACRRAARPELLAKHGCLGPSLAPPETLVLYAAAPGRPTSEAAGATGHVAAELLAALDRPGIGAEEAMRALRAGVVRRSGDKQIPWQLSTLSHEVVLVAPDSVAKANQSEARPDAEAAVPRRLDGSWRAVGVGLCSLTLTATISGGRIVGKIEQLTQTAYFDGPVTGDGRLHAEFDAPTAGFSTHLYVPATLDGVFPDLELTAGTRCGNTRFRLVEAGTDAEEVRLPSHTPTSDR